MRQDVAPRARRGEACQRQAAGIDGEACQRRRRGLAHARAARASGAP